MITELVLFLVGIVVGTMNAVGGGGMLIGFPVLLATGMPPLVANVTANIVLIPGQLASAFGYRAYLRKLPARYLILLIPCLIGGVIGALVLRNTSNYQFEQLVPWLVLFAVLLFAFQPYLHFHLHRHITKRNRRIKPLFLIGLALLPTAIYGGYFGVGFGFIMLAFLGFTKLHDIHQMNGLKNLAGATIALASLVCLFTTGLIDWSAGLAMASGCTIGGYGGARVSQRFSSHSIRIVIIFIGLCAASFLALKTHNLV